MDKTYVIKLSNKKSFRFELDLPNFKKEGILAWLPILNWMTWIVVAYHMIFLFVSGSFGLTENSDTGTIGWVYFFTTILIGLQIIKSIIGGSKFFPKTVLDIMILLFAGAVVLSTLLSGERFSVFGDASTIHLSAVTQLVLLLFYYLLTINTLTKQKITAFAGLVIFSTFFFYLLGFFGGIGLSAREEGFLTIVLFPLSFVYFLYGKNLLFRFFGFVNFVMGIFLMNFESFSLASTFLLSSLIFGFLLLFSNKEIHIKGKGILNIVKSLWKLLFGTVVLFTVFFLSVLNSVSTYTNVQFQKFTSGFEVGHASLSEWLFGGTLVSATGSLFADILAGYGLFGITGFAVLILLVLYFSFRNLSLVEESDKKVINLASIFMILSFIFFMLQESVNALAVVVLWIVFVLVGSIATEHKFAQSFETIKIQKFGKKEKIIKAVSIVVTALLTVVLLSWARNIIV